MSPVSQREEGPVYSAIGELLSDDELEKIVRKATGKDLYNDFASIWDSRAVKIEKVVEVLKDVGNERWLMTYVLVHAAAQDLLREKWVKLSEKVVRVFPKTLVRLPRADDHVAKVLN